MNIDQTGINLIPSGKWTMAEEGSRWIEVIRLNDKRQITATFGACMDDMFLPMQILYQGKTFQRHSKFAFPTVSMFFIQPTIGQMRKLAYSF